MAVFFVLFTAADIALPQYFCGGEEVGGIPLGVVTNAPAEVSEHIAGRSAWPMPEDQLPGQDSDQAPHEEDCFCCCAHVLPSLNFTTVAACELKSPHNPLEQASLLSPTLPLQYHPPRVA